MSSRLWRSLVLTTLLALLLGVSGAAARTSLAANTPDTRVAGIDVDSTTIPELQKLMNTHRLSSVRLTNFYLQRIRQLNPKLNAVITVSPTALFEAIAADLRRHFGDRRPLLGIPIIVKDNVGTTRMPTTAGSWALAGSTPERRVHRAEAEGRRRDHHRQGQPVRVGQLPVRPVVERLERYRWPDEHALRARSQPMRLELRLRRRRGC